MSLKKPPKLLSFILIFCFLFSDIARANPLIGVPSPSEVRQSASLDLQIPCHLGSVGEVYFPKNDPTAPFVIHLQTVHAHYETAYQIKNIIQMLHEAYGIDLLFAEGAGGKLHPEFLQFSKDSETNVKILDELTKVGELTGPDLAVSSGNGLEVVGIEKADFYRPAFKLFRKVIENSDKSSLLLEKERFQIDLEASKAFPPALRNLVGEWLKFESGHRDFAAILDYLREEAKKSLQLDFQDVYSQFNWPQLSRITVLQELEKRRDEDEFESEKTKLVKWLEDHKLSSLELIQALSINSSNRESENIWKAEPREKAEAFVAEVLPLEFKFQDYPHVMYQMTYEVLQSELEARLLFSELETLFEQLLEVQVTTPQAQTILQKYRNLIQLQKLLKLELSVEDWNEIKRNPTQLIDQSLNREALLPTVEAAAKFYLASRKREEAFLENITSALQKKKQKVAILVTGGFHAEGMKELFRQKHMGYAEVTPFISGDFKDSPYHEVMLRKAHMEKTDILMAAPEIFRQLGPEASKDFFSGELANVREAHRQAGASFETQSAYLRDRTSLRNISPAPLAASETRSSYSSDAFLHLNSVIVELERAHLGDDSYRGRPSFGSPDTEGHLRRIGTYAPSFFDEIVKAFEAVRVGPKDTLLELGAGSLRASTVAAGLYGASASAYEQNPEFVALSRRIQAELVNPDRTPPESLSADAINSIQIIEDDFLSVLRDPQLLKEFSIIYYYGFGSESENQIGELLSQNMGAQAIFILDDEFANDPLRRSQFPELEEVTEKFPIDNANIRFFIRKDADVEAIVAHRLGQAPRSESRSEPGINLDGHKPPKQPRHGRSEVRGIRRATNSEEAIEILKESTSFLEWKYALDLLQANGEPTVPVTIAIARGIHITIPIYRQSLSKGSSLRDLDGTERMSHGSVLRESTLRYLATRAYLLGIEYGTTFVAIGNENRPDLISEDDIQAIQDLLTQGDLSQIRDTTDPNKTTGFNGIRDYANAGKDITFKRLVELTEEEKQPGDFEPEMDFDPNFPGYYPGVDVGGGSIKFGVMKNGELLPLPENFDSTIKTVLRPWWIKRLNDFFSYLPKTFRESNLGKRFDRWQSQFIVQESGLEFAKRIATHPVALQKELGIQFAGVGIVAPGAADLEANKMATLGQIPNVKGWAKKETTADNIEQFGNLIPEVTRALRLTADQGMVRNDMDGVLKGVLAILPKALPGYLEKTGGTFRFDWMGTGHGYQSPISGYPFPGPTEAGHRFIDFGKFGDSIYDTESQTSIPSLIRRAVELGFPDPEGELKPIGEAAANPEHEHHEAALEAFQQFADSYAINLVMGYELTQATGIGKPESDKPLHVLFGGGITGGQSGTILRDRTLEKLKELGFEGKIEIQLLSEAQIKAAGFSSSTLGPLGAATLSQNQAELNAQPFHPDDFEDVIHEINNILHVIKMAVAFIKRSEENSSLTGASPLSVAPILLILEEEIDKIENAIDVARKSNTNRAKRAFVHGLLVLAQEWEDIGAIYEDPLFALPEGDARGIANAKAILRDYPEILALKIRSLNWVEQDESPNEANLQKLLDGVILIKSEVSNNVTKEYDPRAQKIITHKMELFSVLLNLVKNALEATNGQDIKDFHVKTSLVSEDGQDRVVITIQDNGHGISLENLALNKDGIPRIFERGVSTKGAGRGLGLNMVRQLVNERLGGSIHVESNPRPEDLEAQADDNYGTTFTVTLPINLPSKSATAEVHPSRSEVRNTRSIPKDASETKPEEEEITVAQVIDFIRLVMADESFSAMIPAAKAPLKEINNYLVQEKERFRRAFMLTTNPGDLALHKHIKDFNAAIAAATVFWVRQISGNEKKIETIQKFLNVLTEQAPVDLSEQHAAQVSTSMEAHQVENIGPETRSPRSRVQKFQSKDELINAFKNERRFFKRRVMVRKYLGLTIGELYKQINAELEMTDLSEPYVRTTLEGYEKYDLQGIVANKWRRFEAYARWLAKKVGIAEDLLIPGIDSSDRHAAKKSSKDDLAKKELLDLPSPETSHQGWKEDYLLKHERPFFRRFLLRQVILGFQTPGEAAKAVNDYLNESNAEYSVKGYAAQLISRYEREDLRNYKGGNEKFEAYVYWLASLGQVDPKILVPEDYIFLTQPRSEVRQPGPDGENSESSSSGVSDDEVSEIISRLSGNAFIASIPGASQHLSDVAVYIGRQGRQRRKLLDGRKLKQGEGRVLAEENLRDFLALVRASPLYTLIMRDSENDLVRIADYVSRLKRVRERQDQRDRVGNMETDVSKRRAVAGDGLSDLRGEHLSEHLQGQDQLPHKRRWRLRHEVLGIISASEFVERLNGDPELMEKVKPYTITQVLNYEANDKERKGDSKARFIAYVKWLAAQGEIDANVLVREPADLELSTKPELKTSKKVIAKIYLNRVKARRALGLSQIKLAYELNHDPRIEREYNEYYTQSLISQYESPAFANDQSPMFELYILWLAEAAKVAPASLVPEGYKFTNQLPARSESRSSDGPGSIYRQPLFDARSREVDSRVGAKKPMVSRRRVGIINLDALKIIFQTHNILATKNGISWADLKVTPSLTTHRVARKIFRALMENEGVVGEYGEVYLRQLVTDSLGGIAPLEKLSAEDLKQQIEQMLRDITAGNKNSAELWRVMSDQYGFDFENERDRKTDLRFSQLKALLNLKRPIFKEDWLKASDPLRAVVEDDGRVSWQYISASLPQAFGVRWIPLDGEVPVLSNDAGSNGQASHLADSNGTLEEDYALEVVRVFIKDHTVLLMTNGLNNHDIPEEMRRALARVLRSDDVVTISSAGDIFKDAYIDKPKGRLILSYGTKVKKGSLDRRMTNDQNSSAPHLTADYGWLSFVPSSDFEGMSPESQDKEIGRLLSDWVKEEITKNPERFSAQENGAKPRSEMRKPKTEDEETLVLFREYIGDAGIAYIGPRKHFGAIRELFSDLKINREVHDNQSSFFNALAKRAAGRQLVAFAPKMVLVDLRSTFRVSYQPPLKNALKYNGFKQGQVYVDESYVDLRHQVEFQPYSPDDDELKASLRAFFIRWTQENEAMIQEEIESQRRITSRSEVRAVNRLPRENRFKATSLFHGVRLPGLDLATIAGDGAALIPPAARAHVVPLVAAVRIAAGFEGTSWPDATRRDFAIYLKTIIQRTYLQGRSEEEWQQLTALFSNDALDLIQNPEVPSKLSGDHPILLQVMLSSLQGAEVSELRKRFAKLPVGSKVIVYEKQNLRQRHAVAGEVLNLASLLPLGVSLVRKVYSEKLSTISLNKDRQQILKQSPDLAAHSVFLFSDAQEISTQMNLSDALKDYRFAFQLNPAQVLEQYPLLGRRLISSVTGTVLEHAKLDDEASRSILNWELGTGMVQSQNGILSFNFDLLLEARASQLTASSA